MANEPLTAEDRAEYFSLHEELGRAERRAAEALATVGNAHLLEGVPLTLFEEANHEIAELQRRIKEIEARQPFGIGLE